MCTLLLISMRFGIAAPHRAPVLAPDGSICHAALQERWKAEHTKLAMRERESCWLLQARRGLQCERGWGGHHQGGPGKRVLPEDAES